MKAFLSILYDMALFAFAAYVVCGSDRASLALCAKVWTVFIAMAVFVAVASLLMEGDK
jgi:hypothetical protein